MNNFLHRGFGEDDCIFSTTQNKSNALKILSSTFLSFALQKKSMDNLRCQEYAYTLGWWLSEYVNPYMPIQTPEEN